jgi:hypothetical protein
MNDEEAVKHRPETHTEVVGAREYNEFLSDTPYRYIGYSRSVLQRGEISCPLTSGKS